MQIPEPFEITYQFCFKKFTLKENNEWRRILLIRNESSHLANEGSKLAKFRIKFLEECCMGCGNCQEVCPDNWALKGGLSHPLKTELDNIACNRQAAEECPESCIEILEI